MSKAIWSLILLLVGFSTMFMHCKNKSAANPQTAPEWSTDFESGAGENFHYRKDGSIGFSIAQDPGGDQYLWFYFRIVNREKKQLKFTIENAAHAHQAGRRWNITRPVFSADGSTWVHADKFRYSDVTGIGSILGRNPQFHFQSPIDAETLWVAYSYPYTNGDLAAFLKTIDHRKEVTISSIGKSEQGRDIIRIDITGDTESNEKPRIWVIGREHPGETPQSFLCEGMISALLESAAGRELRTVFDFTFVPIVNPDGVALGHYYHNATSVNLSRDWEEFKSAEARAVRDALVNDIEENGVRLLINLHSSNDPTKGHYFLVIPEKYLNSEDAEFQKNILRAAAHKHPQLQGRATVSLYDFSDITGNAMYHDFGLYNFYIESGYNRGADGSMVTQASLRQTGAALVEILAEVLFSQK